MGNHRSRSGTSETPWTVAHQSPLCTGFFQQEYWSGFSSVAQSCPTLCDPMGCSTPGLPVHHQLLEFTQTHVHWIGDAIQPSHPLLSPSPPALNVSQHQGLFNWVSCSHQVLFPSPGDLPNPGIEAHLSHYRQILYCLSHQRSPELHLLWFFWLFVSFWFVF